LVHDPDLGGAFIDDGSIVRALAGRGAVGKEESKQLEESVVEIQRKFMAVDAYGLPYRI